MMSTGIQEEAKSHDAFGQEDTLEKPEQSPDGLQLRSELIALVAANSEDFMALVREANEANATEKEMKVWPAVKTFRKAIFWSIVLSSAIIMEGYDTAIVNSYPAFPSFTQRFGVIAKNGSHQIPSRWQNGISGAKNVGEIMGLQFAGFFAERIGYRFVITAALVGLTAFLFIPFFANSLAVFLVGELFMGISWGVFQTMTVAYAAEVCPVPLRHYLTAYVNLCWIIGQFISSGVLLAFERRKDIWGYKIPFALQWIWPVPLIIGVLLAPESPWWHVRHGRKNEAAHSIRRLAKSNGLTQRQVDATVALMIYTNELERQLSQGTSYLDCFKGTDLRRTEVVCLTWVAQSVCGGVMGGPYFFENAGISTSASFKLNWGGTAINFCGTVASWFVMNKVGRRTLIMSGMSVMFICLIIAGSLGVAQPVPTAHSWAIGGVLLFSGYVYDLSVGPVVYTIVSEMPSTRLRAKSIVLGRNAYNIIGIAFVNIVSNRQLNPTAWNWGARAAYFWAGTNLIMLTWMFFRLPETKGRTFVELDILFENRVSARKFVTTKVQDIAASE